MRTRCVELKVCEGCGTLWIRAREAGVYCRGCALWLSEFPAVFQGRRGRKPKSRRVVACVGGVR